MSAGQVWWLIEDKMPEHIFERPKNMAEVHDMVKRAKAKEAREAAKNG